jgi:hypothetical protein
LSFFAIFCHNLCVLYIFDKYRLLKYQKSFLSVVTFMVERSKGHGFESCVELILVSCFCTKEGRPEASRMFFFVFVIFCFFLDFIIMLSMYIYNIF